MREVLYGGRPLKIGNVGIGKSDTIWSHAAVYLPSYSIIIDFNKDGMGFNIEPGSNFNWAFFL